MKSESPDKFDKLSLPTHIAFIMDGNGRWAKKRLLPRKVGHKEGVKAMRNVLRNCFDMGIKVVSVYAFSTENKDRPQEEVDYLMKLIKDNLYDMLQELISMGVKVHFMGDLSYFSDDIRELLDNALSDSRDCDKGVVNIGLNYGARDEIIRAVNRCIKIGNEVDIKSFSEQLDTGGLPDPDLIVRTGGECRLSNFMLFQAAYSEIVVRDTLWPDFNRKELYAVLTEFSKRNRRFGKI